MTKPIADPALNAITYGVRKRVKAGLASGELFARNPEDWRRRVDAMADAVKVCARPSASQAERDALIDTVCSLGAAAYFATAPEPVAV